MPDTVSGSSKMPVAVCQCIEQAVMPRLAWFEGDFEAESAVGVYRFCWRVRRGNRHRAAEVTIAVGGAQMLVRFGPLRDDPAPPDNSARLHLEDICEVTAERDLELEPHRCPAIVGDVKIFVHATANRSAYRKAQGPRRDRAVFGEQGPIGEEYAGCVVVDGATVQQLPGFAVGRDGPTADNARIEEVEPLFARPVDLSVLLGDQHRLALVDEICGGPTWTLNAMRCSRDELCGTPSDEIYPFSR